MFGMGVIGEAGLAHPASDRGAVGYANRIGIGGAWVREMSVVMAVVRNLSMLRVKTPMSSGDRAQGQAFPSAV
eukprot:10273182-Ditylum_brightwellii.AAC.1